LILICDEGVDRPIVDRLRQDGLEVLYVAEMSPGLSDDQVLDEANRSAALLVTADKDFGELVYRQGRITSGVLLRRLAGLSEEEKTALVSAVMREHGTELQGAFSVVSRGRLRVRPRSSPPA
jgi:predicted nuclease of predicted toxin-antitoxin system